MGIERLNKAVQTIPTTQLLPNGGGAPAPVNGDVVKVFEDLQIILEIAMAVFILIAKLQGLGYLTIGVTNLGIYGAKAVFKAIEMKLDKKDKNKYDHALDIIAWIDIVTNMVLSSFILIGQEKAILFSAIGAGVSCGTRAVKMITKRTVGKTDDRYSCFC